MSWGKVRGHDRVVAELRQALVQGRFPHALLFVGPEGIGKRRFATALAQALLCERHGEAELEACGQCWSCRLVATDSHPDVLLVARPEEKHELPIDAIRQLCQALGLKPVRGARRVAIVDDADDLSTEAANAFLKALEEPPPGSVLVLIGTAPDLQLETIKSRCRVVRFDPLPEHELASVLVDQHLVTNRAEAEKLAAWGEGSVGRAIALADPDLGSFRRLLLDELSRGFDPSGLSRQIEKFVSDAGKESAPRRARASLLIGEMAHLFRAAVWSNTGLNPPAPDPADRRAAADLGERLDTEALLDLADRCLQADYHIARKAHIGLVFDSLMHDLGKRINRA